MLSRLAHGASRRAIQLDIHFAQAGLGAIVRATARRNLRRLFGFSSRFSKTASKVDTIYRDRSNRWDPTENRSIHINETDGRGNGVGVLVALLILESSRYQLG